MTNPLVRTCWNVTLLVSCCADVDLQLASGGLM